MFVGERTIEREVKEDWRRFEWQEVPAR